MLGAFGAIWHTARHLDDAHSIHTWRHSSSQPPTTTLTTDILTRSLYPALSTRPASLGHEEIYKLLVGLSIPIMSISSRASTVSSSLFTLISHHSLGFFPWRCGATDLCTTTVMACTFLATLSMPPLAINSYNFCK